jgi:hypothetical protein
MSDQYDGPAMAQQILRLQAAQHGITLRDWFAGQALMGMLADHHTDGSFDSFAASAYCHADAMLKAREVKP